MRVWVWGAVGGMMWGGGKVEGAMDGGSVDDAGRVCWLLGLAEITGDSSCRVSFSSSKEYGKG